ncbi:MAG: M23 family metallopeptidase [Prevotellaceae bacterium]|jgi:murein DD-endopeptidase MepM/ murein hydrolase activator NlpD|nr:M23 family metallopeptidase [Prevotellaceae bacterium]
MAKKLKFNHETLDFDEVRFTVLGIAKRTLVWLIVGGLFLAIYYTLFAQFFSTPQERQLSEINRTISDNYDKLVKQHEQVQRLVTYLHQRDADIYRYIFGTARPNLNVRETSLNITAIEQANNIALTQYTKQEIDKLDSIINRQTERLKSIVELAKGNPQPQSMPTSSPLNSNDFRNIAATYGLRMHPFYKVFKEHSGVDFTAPLGTNVYATGNAIVESVENNLRASGITVTLNHQNGYHTRYAHLFKANVRKGQQVTRGNIIGLVGNSGRTVAPHLHYEVIKDGQTVNPLHYFFKNITPENYYLLMQIATNKGQSLD